MNLPKGWRETPYPESLKEYITKKCYFNDKKNLSIVLTDYSEEKVTVRHLSIATKFGGKVRDGDVNFMKKHFGKGQIVKSYGNHVIPADQIHIRHVLYTY